MRPHRQLTPASVSERRWIRTAATVAVVSVSVVGFLLLLSEETADSAGGSSVGDFLTQDAAALDLEPVRIKFQGPEGEVSLPNAGTIALSDDLNLSVSVNPFPPTTFNVDVDLLLTNADGMPIDGGTITADWDMVFMWHGPFVTEFTPIGNGRYSAPFDLFMFGPWELRTQVTAPGYEQPGELSLSIYIWPE